MFNQAQSGSNPLAYLRNHEQFQQMKRDLQQNPGMLTAFLQKIVRSNPLLQICNCTKGWILKIKKESNMNEIKNLWKANLMS